MTICGSDLSETTIITDIVPVTVIISTRSRGDKVVMAVESILNNDYPKFDLSVLDQSDNDDTENAIQAFRQDARFRYVRATTRGHGARHNEAIKLCETEYIATTDDDCIVETNWIGKFIASFKLDERIGLVFGDVIACEYDITTGYVPIFRRTESLMLKSIKDDLFSGLGIGACFAPKRSAWQNVGGFDELLGPGSPLGSLEDRDVAIRLLVIGYYVYYTPEISVIHYGFRWKHQMRRMAYLHWSGFGSCFAKYLKCGHWRMSNYMLRQMWFSQAVNSSWQHLSIKFRIGRVTPIIMFWIGFIRRLLWPVDHKTYLFKPNFFIENRIIKRLNSLVEHSAKVVISVRALWYAI